ncbi:MAG: hypothetical protein NVSMB32_01400 [Actinomycetota bacterium]
MVEDELGGPAENLRAFDLQLPGRLEAAKAARLALEALHLPDSLRGTARLLTTEVVTNSVRHAGLGPQDLIRVRAEWSGTVLRVSVLDRPRDRSSTVVGAIRPSPTAESGWGLYLVDRLATRWGVNGQGGYWFELAAGASSPLP